MNDLISRKAAIDALRMDISIIPYAKAREYVGAAIEEIYNRLEALPSVQPEPCEDAVSRAEIVRWTHFWFQAVGIKSDRFIAGIKRLPSVQPERKKGKWLIDRGLYKCSCCNQLWAEWWAVSKPIERMNKEVPYCPMCGSYNGEELLSAQPDLLDAKEKDNRKKTEGYICGDTGEACTDCVEKCIYKHSLAKECEAVPEEGEQDD